MRQGTILAAAALAAMAGTAQAQPKLLYTGMSVSDVQVTASGGVLAGGTVLTADVGARALKWTPGGPFTQIGPDINRLSPNHLGVSGGLEISADGNAAAWTLFNNANWGPMSPQYYIVSGGLNVPYTLGHKWTAGGANEWTNLGSFVCCANHCDQTINSVNDLSADGRYTVGLSYYGPTFGVTGCSARAYVCDTLTTVGSTTPPSYNYTRLPLPLNLASNQATNADVCNADASVILGFVDQPATDGTNTSARKLCAWTRSPTTGNYTLRILDDWGAGGLSNAVMSRDGNTVAATVSFGLAQAPVVPPAQPAGIPPGLGDPTMSGGLCTYQRTGTSTWTRTVRGRLPDREFTTDDGQQAVYTFDRFQARAVTPFVQDTDPVTPGDQSRLLVFGTASWIYGNPRTGLLERRGGTYVWRLTASGGEFVEWPDFLAQNNGGQPYPAVGGLGVPSWTSDDGRLLLTTVQLPDSVCSDGSYSLQQLPRGAFLYLDGASAPCTPPTVVAGPYSATTDSYNNLGYPVNIWVAGSYPMTFQWQKETSPGVWTNLTNSCGQFNPANNWLYENVDGTQLRINYLRAGEGSGNYRCVMTNGCSAQPVISPTATITLATGACCYTPPGATCPVCTLEASLRCTGQAYLNGSFLGNGTTCGPDFCTIARPGACCILGSCVAACVAECNANAGTFYADTACSPDPCNGPRTIRCCVGSTCELTTGSCTAPGGNVRAGAASAGLGSACNASGDTRSPCCLADYNKANNVDLLDIFAFLEDWFAGVSFTNHNGDGNANGDLLDIFSFLGDWFNGPCP